VSALIGGKTIGNVKANGRRIDIRMRDYSRPAQRPEDLSNGRFARRGHARAGFALGHAAEEAGAADHQPTRRERAIQHHRQRRARAFDKPRPMAKWPSS